MTPIQPEVVQPKKKGPKAKAKEPTSVEKLAAGLPLDSIALDAPGRARQIQRLAAEIHFTTDLNACSLADLHDHPLFHDIPLKTLQDWAVDGGWLAKREAVIERWRKQIEDRIGEQLVKQRLAAVQELTCIRTAILWRLKPADHEFAPSGKYKNVCMTCKRSVLTHDDPFFGVPGDRLVSALARLVEIEFQLSDVVLRYVSNEDGKEMGGPSGVPALATPKISAEEARVAAHAVLAQRYAEVHAPDKATK